MLISEAFAQTAPGGAGGMDILSMLPLVLMFVLLYFLLLRPQMKRAKEQKQMVESLQKGDEVLSAGGLVGRITKMGEQYLTLEIAPNTEIVVQRSAVQLPLPKGTIKSVQQ
jgi:preprotein translocase subunit YajC